MLTSGGNQYHASPAGSYFPVSTNGKKACENPTGLSSPVSFGSDDSLGSGRREQLRNQERPGCSEPFTDIPTRLHNPRETTLILFEGRFIMPMPYPKVLLLVQRRRRNVPVGGDLPGVCILEKDPTSFRIAEQSGGRHLHGQFDGEGAGIEKQSPSPFPPERDGISTEKQGSLKRRWLPSLDTLAPEGGAYETRREGLLPDAFLYASAREKS